MKYDLIIIGSGSVGSAAGYYATQAGLKVLMIDAHLPPHSEGSHHGDTRLIRHAYGEGERYVPLVLRAQTLWDELAALTEDRIFERTGVVNLLHVSGDRRGERESLPPGRRASGCKRHHGALAGNFCS